MKRLGFWVGGMLLSLYALPVIVSALLYTGKHNPGLQWWQARNDATGMAPAVATTPAAVIQIYAGRAFSWRGILGVHTWIAVKPSGATGYTRYEVSGWGVRRGHDAVSIRSDSAPDGYWFGSRPQLLVDLRGEGVDDLIARVDAAARGYPHNQEYRLWPGPNSNTFTAHIGREVPELGLVLPPTAIGKDYIAGGGLFARSPSGSGVQFSLYGLLGVTVGVTDGLEVNILGLSAGIDPLRPAIKLPGMGRIGWQ
jgi:hypothetical protein